MNILIIGNGFDLAHGLPTRYADFLGFCKMIKNVYTFDERNPDNDKEIEKIWNDMNLDMNDGLEEMNILFRKLNLRRRKLEICDEENAHYSRRIAIDDHFDELYKWINDNVWIDYFVENEMYQKENWIDFENEIGMIIKSIDCDMHGKKFDERIDKLSNKFLQQRFNIITYEDLFIGENEEEDTKLKFSYHEVRDVLYNDLNKLVKALEFYLDEFIGHMECKVISPDIKRVIGKGTEHKYVINGKEFYDYYIVCFNYTKSYEKLYQKCGYIDYIHGKADIRCEFNDMVLGIDEYLIDDRKDKDIEFIAFKKFYQRIYKQTGCKYKEWVDKIKADKTELDDEAGCYSGNRIPFHIYKAKKKEHYLYIFGHSLAVTDRDVLRDIILNDNVYTTIYYLNKEDLGRKIANLVQVIGQDELIRRTGGSAKTIEFRPQEEMTLKEISK